MKDLTDEQLNIAICEWRGWTPTPYGTWTMDPAGLARPHHALLPSHITGIEALGNMHEALQPLNRDQLITFRAIMFITANERNTNVFELDAHDWAIALLRVVNPALFQ